MSQICRRCFAGFLGCLFLVSAARVAGADQPGPAVVGRYAGSETFGAAYDRSALGKTLSDPQLQAMGDDLGSWLAQQIPQSADAPKADSLRRALRLLRAKPSVFGFYPEGSNDWVWCVSLGKDADAARQLWKDLVPVKEGWTTRVSGANTVEVNQAHAEFVFANGQFVVAGNSNLTGQVLARLAAGQPPLAALTPPALSVGEPIFWARVDMPAVCRSVRAHFTEPKQGPCTESILAALGVDALGVVEIAAGFDGPAVRMVANLPTTKRPGGLLAAGVGRPLEDADFRALPSDIVSASVGRLNLAALWDAVMTAIQTCNPDDGYEQFQKGLADSEKELGFKIREDFIAALGDTVTSYSRTAAAPGQMGEMVLMVSLKDAAKLSKCLEKLADYADAHMNQGQPDNMSGFRPAFKRSELAGRPAYYIAGFPMFAPAWTVTSNALCVSVSVTSLRAAVEQKAGAPATSLLDNPDFQRSRQPLPAKIISLRYTDTKQSMAALYGMVTSLAPMIANQPGSPLDLAKLPSLAALQSNLFGSVTVVTADDRGMTINSYSPLGPDFLAGAPALGMFAGMALPAFTQARSQARGHAQASSCLSNLKQVGLACHMYADDHKGIFPAKLEDLVPDYLPNRQALRCPLAAGAESEVAYKYVPGLTTADTGKALAYDAQSHSSGKRNVLFTDGHVEPVSADAFQKLVGPGARPAAAAPKD